MKQFSMKFHEMHHPEKVIGWYVFRKWNGWACFWDGAITKGIKCGDIEWTATRDRERISSGLWSIGRDGKPHPLMVPEWWTDKLPLGVPVQGELWHDSDSTSYIKSICGRTKYDPVKEELWSLIKFKPYLIRPYSLLDIGLVSYEVVEEFKEYIEFGTFSDMTNEVVRPVMLEMEIIESVEDVARWQGLAKEGGWEGLVFTNPKARYELKTTKDVLKWKQVTDHSAKVIGYNEGDGKFAGMCGSLICEIIWQDRIASIFGGSVKMVGRSIRFSVNLRDTSTRDWEYVNTHFSKGTYVDIQFNGVTHNGIPQHPRISND